MSIISKKTKSRKGEYEIFKNNKKIGEVFKSPSEIGGSNGWVGVLTDYTQENRSSGQSVGAKTKYRVIDWFKEWFS